MQDKFFSESLQVFLWTIVYFILLNHVKNVFMCEFQAFVNNYMICNVSFLCDIREICRLTATSLKYVLHVIIYCGQRNVNKILCIAIISVVT